jgi:hypothetical protein
MTNITRVALQNEMLPITPGNPANRPRLGQPPSNRSRPDQREQSDLIRETMKTRSFLILAGLAISFALPSFAQQKDTVDLQVAEQVRALAARYDEAFNKNDATALGALFSEDAVLSGLHGRFNGRQAIENFHSQHVFGRWHVNNRVTTVERVVSVSDEVSSSGRWSETV